MYLLFPGRHHVLTRFQGEFLRQFADRAVVWAVTSANHQTTKRNPVAFDRREAAIERFSVAEGIRSLVVVLWRAGLRIQEALDLYERDLDPRRGALQVRSGKGGRRREVGMDDWGWDYLSAWASKRLEPPAGPLFCIIVGATRGRPRGMRPTAHAPAAPPRATRRARAPRAGLGRRGFRSGPQPTRWPSRPCWSR